MLAVEIEALISCGIVSLIMFVVCSIGEYKKRKAMKVENKRD
jgi:hypothetical protein